MFEAVLRKMKFHVLGSLFINYPRQQRSKEKLKIAGNCKGSNSDADSLKKIRGKGLYPLLYRKHLTDAADHPKKGNRRVTAELDVSYETMPLDFI